MPEVGTGGWISARLIVVFNIQRSNSSPGTSRTSGWNARGVRRASAARSAMNSKASRSLPAAVSTGDRAELWVRQSTFAVALLMPISFVPPWHQEKPLTEIFLVSPNWFLDMRCSPLIFSLQPPRTFAQQLCALTISASRRRPVRPRQQPPWQTLGLYQSRGLGRKCRASTLALYRQAARPPAAPGSSLSFTRFGGHPRNESA